MQSQDKRRNENRIPSSDNTGSNHEAEENGHITEVLTSDRGGQVSGNYAHSKAYTVALGGILTVAALMFSYIESFLPASPGLPGVKLGMANLVILVLLYRTDWKMALTVDILRILLTGLLFTGLFGAVYSLAGGMLSFFIMLLCKKTGVFSVIGVSMAGGVCHNVGQLFIAAAITETVSIFYYLPVLIISGTIAGILIGIVAYILIRAVPERLFRLR